MDRIGRYERHEEIGRGGMGTVFRARDTRLQREVALKLLPAYLSQDNTFSQRFQREAQVIAQLEHPHIVPVYDVGEFEERPFLVMRLLKGGTLRQRLSAGDLTLAELARILQQVAAALDAAHNRGIIHRDIKPSNILFDEQSTAFIADFGVAKVLGANTQLTGSGVIGTPAYMSPEHFTGKSLDGRSDQYSLAIVIYEALTGELPFDGETIQQLIYQHLEGRPRAPHIVNPTLPEALSPILAQALAKQATGRFRTTGHFAQTLTQALVPPSPVAAFSMSAAPTPPPSASLPVNSRPEGVSKTTAAQKLQKVYAQGLQAFNEKDWDTAVTAFAKVLEMEPNHPKARSRYQEAQQRLGSNQVKASSPADGTPHKMAPDAALPAKVDRTGGVVIGAGGQAEARRRFPPWLPILVVFLLIGGVWVAWRLSFSNINTGVTVTRIVIRDVTATWTPEKGSTDATVVGGPLSENIVTQAVEPEDGADKLFLAADELLVTGAEAAQQILLPEETELFVAAESNVVIVSLAGITEAEGTVLLLSEGALVVESAAAQVTNPYGFVAEVTSGTMGVTFTGTPFRFEVVCFTGDCQVLGDVGGALVLKSGEAGYVGGSGQPRMMGSAVDYGRYAAFAAVVPTPTNTPIPSKTPTPTATPTNTPTRQPTFTPTSTATVTPIPTLSPIPSQPRPPTQLPPTLMPEAPTITPYP